jgi:hypothetical protein
MEWGLESISKKWIRVQGKAQGDESADMIQVK